MCGFVGIFRRDDERVDPVLVRRMLKPLEHRGPDDNGVWCGERVGLGHVRLSILDLSERGHQPIIDRGNAGALVYNGEVYNYVSIRDELEREGAVFTSTGDTEVILKALEYWGPEKAIPRFDGMFAFAYFDIRERTLWLARDRLGIKPLYVAESGTEFFFGSEPKGVLAHPQMATRPNRLAVASFILRGRPDPRISFYEGIAAIEPGSWWKINEHGIVRRRWFHVLDALKPERILRNQLDGAVVQLEETLGESVDLHLVSDVPLATICSGGVDSSLITALARKSHNDLTSYVADIPFENGEGNQAQRVADHLGISLTRVVINRERFLRAWPRAVASGGPCFHPSDVALFTLVRVCSEDGIKVLLNGEGADELFGGYLWHEAAFRTYDWRSRLFRKIIPNPKWRRQAQQRLRNTQFNPLPGLGQIGNRAIATIDGEGEVRRRDLVKLLEPIRSKADRALLVRSLDDLYYSLDTLLRRHDRMSMASSVEMRVPFIENELIDLGMHLPRKAKYQRGQSKWVLKQVARKYLPDDIVFAPKKAFPVPGDYDAGSEALLRAGAAGELLHWTTSTRQALVDLAKHDSRLRFLLVGVELWSRLTFHGDNPVNLAEELIATANG